MRFSEWMVERGGRVGVGSGFLPAAGGEELAADGLEEVASPKAH
jgi:hypothetical protein